MYAVFTIWLQYSYTFNMLSIILQVALPAKLAPRMAHCAAVFGSGDFRVIVIFGGSKTPDQNPSDVISGTTMLLLCK